MEYRTVLFQLQVSSWKIISRFRELDKTIFPKVKMIQKFSRRFPTLYYIVFYTALVEVHFVKDSQALINTMTTF